MPITVWLKYIWRQIFRHKARAILTFLGIAFGVALVYAVSISQKSVVDSFSEFVGSLSGHADLQITQLDAPFPRSELAKAKLKEVSKVTGSLIKNDVLITKQEALPVMVFGLEKENYLQSFKVISGHFPRNKKQVLISKDLAQLYKIKISDFINIKGFLNQRSPSSFKVSGYIDSSGIGSVLGGRVMVMQLPAAQELYQLQGKINQISIKVDSVSINTVKQKLKLRFSPQYEVSTPVEKGATAQSIVASTRTALMSFAYLALFSGALIVFNTMRVNVAERISELALLRAIGAGRWQIMQLTFLEALIFGFFGSAFGLLFGHYTARSLASITASTYQLPAPYLTLNGTEAAIAVATGLALTFVATIYPAYLVSRLKPLQATTVINQEANKKPLKLFFLGLFFLLLGLIFYQQQLVLHPTLSFNLALLSFIMATGLFLSLVIKPFAHILSVIFSLLQLNSLKLAARNLARHNLNSTASITTLVIAIILTIGIGELRLSDETLFNKYLKQNFQRDLALGNPIPYSVASANQYPPLPLSLKQEIAKIPGIKRVLPLRIVTTKGLGKRLYTIVIDPRKQNIAKVTFDEGELYQAHKRLLKGGYIFLSTTLSRRHNLHLNDKVKIKTASGWRVFKIAGVYNELANNGEAIYISYGDLKRYWREKGVDSFFIDIKAGAKINEVRAKLADKFARPLGLTLSSHQEERERAAKTVDSILNGFDALVLVTVLIAALSLANVGLINVLKRQRELGILQALGSFKSQIRHLILFEALLTGVFGGLIGVAVGLPLAKLILKLGESLTQWQLNYIFPYKPLLQSALISLLVPPLAYLYGAYRATKIKVIEALRYE